MQSFGSKAEAHAKKAITTLTAANYTATSLHVSQQAVIIAAAQVEATLACAYATLALAAG